MEPGGRRPAGLGRAEVGLSGIRDSKLETAATAPTLSRSSPHLPVTIRDYWRLSGLTTVINSSSFQLRAVEIGVLGLLIQSRPSPGQAARRR